MMPLLFPVISIITGILILLFPEVLNYVIAVYLILIGVVGLVGRSKMF